MSEHLSADGFPVRQGAKFWDNDLRVVEITQVAAWSQLNENTGVTATWHKTTRGSSDTLPGASSRYGRVARWFEGKDAETYEPGTTYADAKQH